MDGSAFFLQHFLDEETTGLVLHLEGTLALQRRMHHETAVPWLAGMGIDNENIPGLADADGAQTLLEFAEALGKIDPDKQDAY